MEGPLGGGPLRLPLFPPVILLGGEGGLHSRVPSANPLEKSLDYAPTAGGAVRYLVLEEVVPGPAAEHKADEELEQVEREVEDDAVEPDYASPAPADALDPGKAPVGVHGQ